MKISINKPINSILVYECNQILKSSYVCSFSDTINGISNLVTLSRQFSVSYDVDFPPSTKVWSPYFNLCDEVLMSHIDFSKPFHIKFKYEILRNLSNTKLFLVDISFDTDDTFNREIIKVDLSNGIEILPEIDIPNIHEIGSAVSPIINSLNYFINKRGVEALYFLVEPKSGYTDTVLSEYTLYNVVNKGGTCINISIEDMNIPDPKTHTYDEFGVNFDHFDIEINKMMFESIFGTNRTPRANDFLFIPRINRMYTVRNMILDRGLDGKPTNYMLTLDNYDDNTSVIKDKETEDFLNSKTLKPEDIFEDEWIDEMEDALDDQQASMKTINIDQIRYSINPNMSILSEEISNNGSILMKYQYDISNVSEDEIAVKYKLNHELRKDSSMAVAMWLYSKANKVQEEATCVYQEKIQRGLCKIRLDKDLKLTSESSLISNSGNIYDIENIEGLDIIIKSDSISDSIRKANKINLHRTIDGNKFFSIDLLENKILRIRYNHIIYDFVVNITIDKWYTFMINISNVHKWVGLTVWSMKDNAQAQDRYSTHLECISNDDKILNDDIILSDESVAAILGSNSKLSNIRIFRKTIEYEYQSLVMGTIDIKKPSLAFVIDNCEPIFNFGDMGRGITKIYSRIDQMNDLKMGRPARTNLY